MQRGRKKSDNGLGLLPLIYADGGDLQMSTTRVSMNVVLFREGNVWIAQGLEHNLVAQGRDAP